MRPESRVIDNYLALPEGEDKKQFFAQKIDDLGPFTKDNALRKLVYRSAQLYFKGLNSTGKPVQKRKLVAGRPVSTR
jgi:hypothetical protein